MPSSSVLTATILQAADKEKIHRQILASARYFIAQGQATATDQRIDDQYYLGCRIIPGPKADPALSALLPSYHPDELKRMGIGIIDHVGTSNASPEMTRAAFGILSDEEANHYESVRRTQLGMA